MIWKPAYGFEGYLISDTGLVKSLIKKKPALLKPSKSWTGYLIITIGRTGSRRSMFVHRLVLEAFGFPKPSPKHQTAHYDGNRTNNNLSNLRWATGKENHQDKIRLGKNITPNGKISAKEREEIRKAYKVITYRNTNAQDLADKYGVNKSTITRIVTGKSWVKNA